MLLTHADCYTQMVRNLSTNDSTPKSISMLKTAPINLWKVRIRINSQGMGFRKPNLRLLRAGDDFFTPK